MASLKEPRKNTETLTDTRYMSVRTQLLARIVISVIVTLMSTISLIAIIVGIIRLPA